MSEIDKYRKYLKFKANPRFLRRDFIVPLYTGTEPDIVPETSVEELETVQEFGDGGRVGFEPGGKVGNPGGTAKKIYANLTGSITELNKGAKYLFDKKYIDLNRDQKERVRQRLKYGEGKFIKETKFDPFPKEDQNKIKKVFPDADFTIGKFGFPQYIDGKLNPKYTAVSTFVKNNFKEKQKIKPKPLSLNTQKDIMANFTQVPKEKWDFKNYKYGIYKKPDNKLYQRIVNFVKEPVFTPYGFNFSSPSGWMIQSMDRASRQGNEDYVPLKRKGKIIGIQDFTEKGEGKKYYHRTYRGPLNENILFIDQHPDYKKIEKFVNIARDAKVNVPETLIKLFPKGYDTSKLKFNDLLRFMLGDRETNRKLITNAIHVHHAKGLSNPTSDLQLLTQEQNRFAETINQRIVKGVATAEDIQKLKDQGIRLIVDNKSYGARKESAERGLLRIYNQVTDYYNNNPDKLTEFINMAGCGPRVKALGLGGRVKFSNGSDCYVKGLEKIKSGDLSLVDSETKNNFFKESGVNAKTALNLLSSGRKIASFVSDVIVGNTPAAFLINLGFNVPFALAEAAEGKPGRQVLGTATNIPFLGPLVGTTERNEIIKTLGPDSDLYFKLTEAYDRFQNFDKNIKNLEDSKLAFKSPDDAMFTDYEKIDEQIQKLKDQDEKDEELLTNYIDPKTGNLKYPKNIQKRLDISKEQERLRKLQTKFVPSITETTVPEENLSNEEINKQIEDLESQKSMYGSEIDKITTPEDMMQIYEMGARGGAAEGGRIGFSDGGPDDPTKRKFIKGAGAAGLIAAGAKFLPDFIQSLKGTKAAVKLLPKVSGMPEWFNPLVSKMIKEGVEVPLDKVVTGSLPNPDLTKVRQLEIISPDGKGKDIITMMEFKSGQIQIESSGGAFDDAFTLSYNPPKSVIDVTGKKVDVEGSFNVIEQRPYHVGGPEDVDYDLDSFTFKKEDAISDIEKLERIATGKRIPKAKVDQRTKAREFVEKNPYDDIVNRFGDAGDYYDDLDDIDEIIK